MTVQNTLHPTTFPPMQRERPTPAPESSAKPEGLPAEPTSPALPGGLIGNNVNTTA